MLQCLDGHCYSPCIVSLSQKLVWEGWTVTQINFLKYLTYLDPHTVFSNVIFRLFTSNPVFNKIRENSFESKRCHLVIPKGVAFVQLFLTLACHAVCAWKWKGRFEVLSLTLCVVIRSSIPVFDFNFRKVIGKSSP